MKKVVILGDSISMGYRDIVKNQLQNDAEFWFSEDNCRFSSYTLRKLFDCKDQIKGADIIVWNNGQWDICKLFDDDVPFTPIKQYVKTMSYIADLLLKMAKKVIFVTTTPVKSNNPYNDNNVIDRYNKAITKVLKKKGIIIHDLHAVINENIDKYICDDLLHLSEEGAKVSAISITKVIKNNL